MGKITEALKVLAEGGAIDRAIIFIPVKPVKTMMGIAFTDSDTVDVQVPFRITEERYKIKDGYKIGLEPMIPGFGKQSFYLMDFESLAREMPLSYRIFIKTDNGTLVAVVTDEFEEAAKTK